MNRTEQLAAAYERHVSLPWSDHLSGHERVWFVVYPPADERKLRKRLQLFEMATQRAGHKWIQCDVTHALSQWLSGIEYRESYFECPEDLDPLRPELVEYVAQRIREKLSDPAAGSSSVVAVIGLASLFGFVRVSTVIEAIRDEIPGRLAVFFPGEYDGHLYRLLDAQDGWDYLAVPITV